MHKNFLYYNCLTDLNFRNFLSAVSKLIDWAFECTFQNFEAKLSDFGLARLGPPVDKSHVTTQAVGTYGYAAPEYINTG